MRSPGCQPRENPVAANTYATLGVLALRIGARRYGRAGGCAGFVAGPEIARSEGLLHETQADGDGEFSVAFEGRR